MNLSLFNTANLFEATTNLFQQLNIKLNSNTAEPLPVNDLLKQYYKENDAFKAIDKTFFIGIIDDTVFKATGMPARSTGGFDNNYSYKEAIEQGDKNYNGLMLFALELNRQPTRTEIAELTRTFNRISQKMPVALVLKYAVDKEAVISIAISERFKYLQNWRQGEKAGKVIILRDIHTQSTHAGHTRILLDLVKPVGVSTYEQLHQHWLEVLDVSVLNRKFFQDLSNWYFAAMTHVSFPDDLEKKKEVRNATNLIRLITRFIFIWFIKEKQLVPASLFRKEFVAGILTNFNKNKKSLNYYNAILQNLFFGTLNQKMEERKFAKEGDIRTNKEEYGVKNLFRYADLFSIPEKEVLGLFKDVPFLNGGLFDCLDKPNDEGKIEYVDGFSRNPKKQASVPDYIFFGEEKEVDLNEIYGTRNKTYKSRGLINLLESYKFTVAENTPIEEEIALDPELLGKVFENLLASYNPETQTTARKQTGSFYTPREIVNYMVDESLLEYIKQNVKNDSKDFEARLRDVFSYSANPNPFNEAETKDLIEAINNCKILDPACGSGAFPMGILHKMVHILQKLDPENKFWKDLQRKKAIEETETAFNIGDKEERAKRLAEINDVFENNAGDYGRKLYLIENCIYGIDIQPIAVQIAKLRFFISLVIDQKVNKSKENFGVRSLPNLETKFVAANTLIGLDKPAQTVLRNPDIEVKENQLKELRHKYFTASTRKEKLQYQKQDKRLRQEIAKMLESDGWQTKVAKQIVAFDPYDQNQSSGWFDTEWMFGLTKGFDIVIGNPPYGANIDEFILLFEKLYPKTSSGFKDIYKYFFNVSLSKLSNTNGILCFITPNTFFLQPRYVDLRKFLLEFNIHSLINLGEDVFEAVVPTAISIIERSKVDQYNIIKFADISDESKYTGSLKELNFEAINQNIFYHAPNSIFAENIRVKKGDEIPLEQILDFKDAGINYQRVNVGLSDKGNSDLSERLLYVGNKEKESHIEFWKGTDIDEYYISTHTNRFVRPNIRLKDNERVILNIDYFELKPKLIWRQTASIPITVIDRKGIWFGRSIQAGIIKNSYKDKISYEYLCALLNSKFIRNIYEQSVKEGGRVFPQVKLEKLKHLPIKIIPKDQQIKFIEIVQNIEKVKKKNPNVGIEEFKKDLNRMIYYLYELSDEEIKIIEGKE